MLKRTFFVLLLPWELGNESVDNCDRKGDWKDAWFGDGETCGDWKDAWFGDGEICGDWDDTGDRIKTWDDCTVNHVGPVDCVDPNERPGADDI